MKINKIHKQNWKTTSCVLKQYKKKDTGFKTLGHNLLGQTVYIL